MQHLAHGKLGFPGIAPRRYEMNEGLGIADIADHAADEAVVFAELLECFQYPFVDEAEIGSARCDVDRKIWGLMITKFSFVPMMHLRQ